MQVDGDGRLGSQIEARLRVPSPGVGGISDDRLRGSVNPADAPTVITHRQGATDEVARLRGRLDEMLRFSAHWSEVDSARYHALQRRYDAFASRVHAVLDGEQTVSCEPVGPERSAPNSDTAELAAVLAHQWLNCFAVISGSVQTLLADGARLSVRQQNELFRSIARQLDRLHECFSGLTDAVSPASRSILDARSNVLALKD